MIVATNVGVRPGPEAEIGHKPLVLELSIVSGLSVGPDCSVLADQVEVKHEEFDVGERFAVGEGGKSALQSVNAGNAILFPKGTVFGDYVEFAVVDYSANAVILLMLSIEVG